MIRLVACYLKNFFLILVVTFFYTKFCLAGFTLFVIPSHKIYSIFMWIFQYFVGGFILKGLLPQIKRVDGFIFFQFPAFIFCIGQIINQRKNWTFPLESLQNCGIFLVLFPLLSVFATYIFDRIIQKKGS